MPHLVKCMLAAVGFFPTAFGLSNAYALQIVEPMAHDLFVTGDITISVETDSPSDCSYSPAGGGSAVTVMTASTTSSFSVPANGDYVLECSDTGDSATVEFAVDDDAHGKLLLVGHDVSVIRERYLAVTADVGHTILNNQNYAYPSPRFCYKYYQGLAGVGGPIADHVAPFSTNSNWVHACAFWNLLYAYGNLTLSPADPNYWKTAPFSLPSDQRTIEDLVYAMLVAYFATQDTGYRDNAIAWVEGLYDISYDAANVEGWKSHGGFTLRTSHWLRTVAVAYDWLYPDLTPDQRRRWRDLLLREANVLYEKGIYDMACVREFEAGTAPPYAITAYVDESECYSHNSAYLESAVLYLNPTAPGDNSLSNGAKRFLLHNINMHMNSALGMAGYALYSELKHDSATRDHWLNVAEFNIDLYLDEYFASGANHESIGYWGYGLNAILLYLESRRVYASDVDLKYHSGYLKNTSDYFVHMRLPNMQSSNLFDWDYSLRAEFLTGMSRLAAQHSNRLAQRMSWLGPTAGSTFYTRNPLDVLWFDPTLTPETNVSTIERHHLFEDFGLASLRTGHDPNATHLLVFGGTRVGNHDSSFSGTFNLFAKNHHLVTDHDYLSGSSARTLASNTILVNGHGQHNDFRNNPGAPPQDSSASIFAFIGTNESAARPMDLVSMATDLTTAYDYSDTTNNQGLWQEMSDLDQLQRYFVWIGGEAILVLDRFLDSAGYRYDWIMNTRAFSNETDAIVCDTAPDSLNPGYYSFSDPTGGTVGMVFGKSTAIHFADGSTVYRESTVHEDFNYGKYVPHFDDPTCETDSDNVDTSGPAGTAVVSNGDARLKVEALDAYSSNFEEAPSLYRNGAQIDGRTLRRHTIGNSFLTALLPYNVSDGSPAATVGAMSGVTGGTGISVSSDREYRVLFADATLDPAVSEVITAGQSAKASLAVLAYNSRVGTTPRFADLHTLQVIQGQKVVIDGDAVFATSLLSPSTADPLVTASISYRKKGAEIEIKTDVPVMLRLRTKKPVQNALLNGVDITVTEISHEHNEWVYDIPVAESGKLNTSSACIPDHKRSGDRDRRRRDVRNEPVVAVYGRSPRDGKHQLRGNRCGHGHQDRRAGDTETADPETRTHRPSQ